MNKILVVDDDTAIRLLYTDEFTEEGYEVITTGHESRLLDLIYKKRPDLVVLDRKPGKNEGLDRLHDIWNTYDDLPVVMSTSYRDFKVYWKSIAGHEPVTKISNLRELKRKLHWVFESCGQFQEETPLNEPQEEGASIQSTM
jgi:two-component system, response regulator, stage 0 sporulation protein F